MGIFGISIICKKWVFLADIWRLHLSNNDHEFNLALHFFLNEYSSAEYLNFMSYFKKRWIDDLCFWYAG